MNLLIILAVLFIALVVIVPLIEKSGVSADNPTIAKLSRWIIPVLIILAVLQLLRLAF